MSLRVAYVSGSIFPSRAANTVNTMRLCRALQDGKYSVELVLSNGKNAASPLDIHSFYKLGTDFAIHQISSSYTGKGYRYLAAWQTAIYLRKSRPDVVYGRDLIALRFCAFLGMKVVYDAHRPPGKKHSLSSFVISGLWKSSNLRAVTIISEALRRDFEHTGIDPSRIYLIRNASEPMAKVAPRLSSKEPIIGYAGHLYRGRGVEIIIEAARALPEYRFLLVGGTDEDIAYWKAQRLPENVLLTGYVPASEVASYLRSCSLLLAPYQEEVMVWGGKENSVRYMSPIKLFEYMSSGIPMIVSDLPAIREFMNPEIALLVPPTPAQAWVEAIRSAMTHSAKSNQIAEQALKAYEQRHSWKRKVECLREVFVDQV